MEKGWSLATSLSGPPRSTASAAESPLYASDTRFQTSKALVDQICKFFKAVRKNLHRCGL